jgi:hypothetical protein
MLVTPAMAKRWLDESAMNGDHNRKSSSAHIVTLARAMRSGHWLKTHQGLAFSKTGRFLDGWHRCKACILANTPFTTLVSTGLDDTAMSGIDLSARVRNTANLLEMSGEVSSVQLSTVLGFLFQYANGTIGTNIQGGGKGASGASYERAAMLERYPGVRTSVKFVSSSEVLRRAFAANAALHAIATLNGRGEEVETFLTQAASGVGMKDHTGVYEWNKKLTLGSKNHLWGRSQYRLALAIKCFNAFLEDKPLRNLSWKFTEDYPKVLNDTVHASLPLTADPPGAPYLVPSVPA